MSDPKDDPGTGPELPSDRQSPRGEDFFPPLPPDHPIYTSGIRVGMTRLPGIIRRPPAEKAEDKPPR